MPSRAEKADADIMFYCICSNEFMILIPFYLILCKMLYSQLTFVLLLAYLGLYIQFSIQQGYESHGRERDMFCQFVNSFCM